MGTRPIIRLAALATGGLLALAVATPALAAETTLSLKDEHKNTTAKDFAEEDQKCDNIFAAKKENEDGWHFVLAQFDGISEDDLTDLSLSFTDLNDNPTEVSLEFIGSFTHNFDVTGGVLHLWLLTPAGWTLVDGSATLDDSEHGVNPQFNLSHTCPGEPDGKTTPPDDGTTPPGDETTPPGDETTPPGEDEKPGLPVTGTSLGGLMVLGGGLLAAGIALIAVRRRRTLTDLLDS